MVSCCPEPDTGICLCSGVGRAWGTPAHLAGGIPPLRWDEIWGEIEFEMSADRMEGGDLCPDCFQPHQRQTPCQDAKIPFVAKPSFPAGFCAELRVKPVRHELCQRIWGGRGVSHSSSLSSPANTPSPRHATESTDREKHRGMDRLLPVTSRAQSPARDAGRPGEAEL